MKYHCAAITLICAFFSVPARADVAISAFSKDLFTGCVQGRDIGSLTKSSNPILLLGSVVYTGKVLNDDGTIGSGLVRVPLPLPLITSDAGSPDISTCEHNFQTSADGSISFLGFSLNAAKSDIYKVSVKLVTRQRLAPIAQSGANVQPWFADLYQNQFKQILQSADAAVTDFFLFDNISIYLLQVERYKKANGGLAGAFGAVVGGGSYSRDESFKGTKLIVTGDPVPLTRTMFKANAPLAGTQLPISGPNVMNLTAGEAFTVSKRLTESSAN
ncbi:hypothetical protein KRZ98_12790 [Sphingobium sp. AS12]|uniref:hypothetical protein n=1 Tax=Sphingobium sp. AS12 TaxID=2849495 RepID=UPI001C31A926|nr:hypothetical protein [Sphingobium sp. AS12]MBV2149157.1 hypothetical protein [Sphingobium sp. AS12]